MRLMRFVALIPLLLLASSVSAQVIEFESGGLKYQTLTKTGVTIMYAHLPATVREYVTIQVAVSNGARQPVIIRPEDFSWQPASGPAITPVAARPPNPPVPPARVAGFHAARAVTASGLADAARLLVPDAPAVFGRGGRLCDPATHRRWAERILRRAELYGVADPLPLARQA